MGFTLCKRLNSDGRHGVSRKRNTKRLKHIGNLFRKNLKKKKKKKNFMAPFYGWGSAASRPEPLRGGSLLFTTKFPEVPGTHFIDLGRMKG